MRFSLALVSIAAGVAVQARPSPVSRDLAKTGAGSDKIVEARGLVDDLGLGDMMKSKSDSPTSSSSTATSSLTSSTSSATSSPSTSSASSAAATPTSSVKPKLKAPAGVKTHDNDLVTTVHDAGTTNDRVGFRWSPINPFA